MCRRTYNGNDNIPFLWCSIRRKLVYSPFSTGHFNDIAQHGATAQIVNHVGLIRRGTAVSLCSMETPGESLMPPNLPPSGSVTTSIDSDSLVQIRSGSVHTPPVHVTRPLPLVLLYPSSQAKVTEAPSGKELWTRASWLSDISFGATGLTQSAAGKNGSGRSFFAVISPRWSRWTVSKCCQKCTWFWMMAFQVI